jgi:RNA polymerase sigma-70 factor, ECF subfamily
LLFPRGPKDDGFENVALPHLKDLFRTASRLVGSAVEAEDLVQETYLQAWKSFGRFQPGTDCRAWLYRILFNVISHYRRKPYKIKTVQSEPEFFEETLAYEPPIPEHIRDEEVLQAFHKVPSHYREVVLLADVQELSYKEIAEVLGIAVGTVMSRLSRGRKLLRQELASFAKDHGINPQRGVGA